AGFDVPVGEERLERALVQGAELAPRLGRLPKFADWTEARREDDALLSEWQIYRMFEGRRGAWAAFQFLVRERLVDDGLHLAADGTLTLGDEATALGRSRRHDSRSSGARTAGSGFSST